MAWSIDLQLVKKCIQDKKISLNCHQLHGNISCNKMAVNCFINTVKASYRTYCFVYMISILMRIRTINLKQQMPTILFNLVKSISFTAIDMMIMRRILCLYNKKIGFDSKSLIYANILGAIALGVQSKGRQIEICLYGLNKAIQTLYNSLKRRKIFMPIAYGEALLFAFSIAVVCYHYINNKSCMRKSYVKIFDLILRNL